MTDEIRRRLDEAERVIANLQAEIAELRKLAAAPPADEPEPEREPLIRPAPEPERATERPPPRPPELVTPRGAWYQDERGRWHERRTDEPSEGVERPYAAPTARAATTEEQSVWRREVDLADLVGAKGLAIVGGAVTLLGIVFFFVLAVNRGWIGPELRVALGAAASVAAFALGVWVHRRYGALDAGLAAVGVGIAGGYATLLAATARYELVPKVLALALAAAIAAAGVAVALAWSSQIVAGLGLVGAMLVPAPFLGGGDATFAAAFAVLVFAATVVLTVREGWDELLWVAAAITVPQVAIRVVQERGEPVEWGTLGIATTVVALLLGAGVVYELRRAAGGLAPLTSAFVLGSATAALGAAHLLLDADGGHARREGAVLLGIAVVYGVLSALLFRRDRPLSLLLAGAAATLGAVAAADLLSQHSLTIAWAAEAAVLAWLAAKTREQRFQPMAIAYAVLAAGHALLYEAHPEHFLSASRHPAGGVASVVAVALALAVIAWYARPEEHGARLLEDWQWAIRSAAMVATVAGAAYALALGILELFQLGGDVTRDFDRGHVAVTAAWGAIGLLAVIVGLRWLPASMPDAGVVWLAVTLVKAAAFDALVLEHELAAYSFLALAVAMLAAAYLLQLLDRRLGGLLHPVPGGAALLALGLASVAVVWRVDGDWGGVDARGVAFAAIAAVYAALAAPVLRRQRDFATLLWAVAGAVAAVAIAQLLGGTWRILGWAALGVVLAALAELTAERRFLLGSGAATALALGATLVLHAPLSDLLVEQRHPGGGIPALLCALAAIGALVWGARAETVEGVDAGKAAAATGAVVAVYTASLGILEAAEEFAPGTISDRFQGGHTGVSALWGTLGLALLYVGLRRASRPLRLAGFALFGVSLVKLFVYDLARLSSVARALSFIAVGALLLLGGFFYQRLSAQLEDRAG